MIGSLSGKWTESPWIGRVDSFVWFFFFLFSLFKCVFGGVGSSSLSVSKRNEESQTTVVWSQLFSLLPRDGNDTARKHV